MVTTHRGNCGIQFKLPGSVLESRGGSILASAEAECEARAAQVEPAVRKPVRKDHNAGGRSNWMQGFFDRPSPPLWKAIGG